MPSITIKNRNKSKKRSKKMQAANYADNSTVQNNKQSEKQSVRVRLSSGIMDELMDKAYVSVYDPFRELIANAYDANAYKVRVEIEDEHSCYIDDDGYGISDFNSFLTKGMTEKREQKKGTSDSGRQLIGEKGLGFLSVFKIAREVDVYSRPGPQTWKVHLTDELIRDSIDTGAPIPVEDAGEFLTYGTRIYLRKLKKSFSVAKLYEYISVAFAPLLTWQFRILINGNEAIAPELPAGIMHERSGEGYSITLVDPYRVEDRKPVRFYNRGVLVKREVVAKRPTLTGYVNTDLSLVTGRGAYVEDDQYHKFKKALDSLIEDIPDAPHYSNVLVQKSLNKLARVLEKALASVDIALPAEYKVLNEQQFVSGSFQVAIPTKSKEKVKQIKIMTGTPRLPREIRAAKTTFGTVKEAQLSPSDLPVMTTTDSIILNLSHPHISQLATIPGSYRDLTLMTFVAEGFVDLLGIKNKEEYKETTDKVIREMLKLYGQETTTPSPAAPENENEPAAKQP
ncbi:MAG: ATP-binding protein [Nitrososphaerota archaeon]|nr:ATP-binding protein [Nitrososphaerota archaeon]